MTLLLIGGFALDARAQQPSAPGPSAPAVPAEPKSQTPDGSAPQPAQPQSPQMQQAPPPSVQTERIIVREPRGFLGVDPTVAMILGAALLIVVIFALVSMGRRRDEVQHTHTHV